MPTDELLQAYRQGIEVPGLIELYFQFGRYILISCSRRGTQAINLWGKWVNTIDPAYNADYHTNINIPMNYWPAQVCNLGECNEPFFDLIDQLRPRGRVSAKIKSLKGGPCRVEYGKKLIELDTVAGQEYHIHSKSIIALTTPSP